MKVVAAGMGGFIGQALGKALSSSHELVVLKRKTSSSSLTFRCRQVVWNPPVLDSWIQEVDGCDAVINLSGEPMVGKKWTVEQKKELWESRIKTTQTLTGAIASADLKPKVFLNASAIGFYGPHRDEMLDESTGPGAGFLSELCKAWEEEAGRAEKYNVRTVFLRTGIVLGKEGGALLKMLTPFKMGLGGPLGSGRQYMSWVHIDDEVGAILWAIDNAKIKGPLNLTAPAPVTMNEFARTLGRVLHRPAFFPVPGFILKLLLGESAEILLTGQRVFPKKLIESGYRFRFQSLQDALKDLVAP